MKKLFIMILIAIALSPALFAAEESTTGNGSSFHFDANAGLEGMFIYAKSSKYAGWVDYTSDNEIAIDLLYRASADVSYSFSQANSLFAGAFIKYYYKPSGLKPDYIGGRIGYAHDYSDTPSFICNSGAYVYGGYYTNLRIIDAGVGAKASIGGRPVGSLSLAANVFVEYPVVFSSLALGKTLIFPAIFYAGASLSIGF